MLRKLSAVMLLLAPSGAWAETAEIRIAEQYGLAFLPLMIMRDQKLVEKHAAKAGLAKLEVVWSRLGAVNAINDALLGGKLDFAAGGVPSLVMLWAKTQGTPAAVRGVVALGDIPNELVVSGPKVKSIRDFGPQDKIAVTAVKISNQAIALQMAAAREFGDSAYAYHRDGPPGRGDRAPLRQGRDHRPLFLASLHGAGDRKAAAAFHPLHVRRARRASDAERDLDASELPR